MSLYNTKENIIYLWDKINPGIKGYKIGNKWGFFLYTNTKNICFYHDGFLLFSRHLEKCLFQVWSCQKYEIAALLLSERGHGAQSVFA